jgi:hypothetical protein
MRFALEQTLPAEVDEVLAALLDPDLLRSMDGLPKLGAPHLLSQEHDGDVVVQRVRYAFTGDLSPAVTRVIDPKKLTWINETTYDLAARRATARILPDHYANKLRCSGTHTFTAGAGTTVRRIDGDLAVSFPIVGRLVERAIVSGLDDHLRAEADLLATWLRNKG